MKIRSKETPNEEAVETQTDTLRAFGPFSLGLSPIPSNLSKLNEENSDKNMFEKNLMD